jgi:putative spermidine/putrescine transport system ATP-binding protein
MQVGTPQEIHDRPANVFVADFMGFRNFFDVELGEGAGGYIEGVAKSRRLRARVNGFARSGNAVMAIRPDDIRVGAAADDQNVLRGKVELVEYLGRELEAAIMAEGQTRIWVRTTEKLALGDTVDVTLPPDKLVVLPRE